jgi:ABC-type transporter MlaC component
MKMKKMNCFSIQSLKKAIVALGICLIPFGLSAQTADSYKSLINKTASAVLEAQKAVIASNKASVDGSLANVFRLQLNAVALFNQQNYALAAYTSNLSRQEAIKLITALNGSANSFYTISDDEKKLFAASRSQSNADQVAKQNFSTLSANDNDYLAPNQFLKTIVIQ